MINKETENLIKKLISTKNFQNENLEAFLRLDSKNIPKAQLKKITQIVFEILENPSIEAKYKKHAKDLVLESIKVESENSPIPSWIA